MKELSIEEKAKAYDEALERAKEWYDDSQIGVGFKANLERLFPGLVEPEDEKTRKEIIKYIEGTFPNEFSGIESKNKWIAWLEKQGEQKPLFNVGDFYTDGYNIYQVKAIGSDRYFIKSDEGHEGVLLFDNEEHYHLWTIQDAKDGDVLFQDLMGGKTFIYNGVNPEMAILYSYIISNDGEDVLPYHIGKPNTGIGNIEENKNIIYPATKEQRDQLEKAMTNAGYKWNASEKKLEKIEQKSQRMVSAEAKEAMYDKPNWSEEDEYRIKDTIYFLETTKKHYDASTEELDACIDWLKSLKDRVVPQKQESSEKDKYYMWFGR